MATFDSKRAGKAAAPAGGDGGRDDGRRAGRLRCTMMGANLGTVHGELLDLSATGARVLLRRNPDLKAGASFKMEIDPGTGIGGSIAVTCQAVWVRLNAEKKFELGVEFQDLPEPARKRLLEAVLHPTRAESLRRGWSVVGGMGIEGEDEAPGVVDDRMPGGGAG